MRRVTAVALGFLLCLPAASLPDRNGTAERQAFERLAADAATPVTARRKPGATAPFFVEGRIPLGKFTSATSAAERGRDFFRKYGAIFGIRDQGAELAVKSVTPDALGMTHVRYDQRHKGLPVFGRQLVVHFDGLAVTSVNGDFADVRDVGTTPSIDAEAALQTAVASLGKRNPIAPKLAPELLVYVDGSGRGWLAWEVGVGTRKPFGFWRVFVDALDGRVLFSYDDLKTARNRMTYTNGNNPLCNFFVAPGCTLPGTIQRTEGQPAIGNAPTDAAHDNAGIVYDYYFNTFARDSYDGAGHTIRSTAHFGDQFVNAFWCDDDCAAAYGSSPDGEQMAYGDGDGIESGPLSQALDIVAHELTHAVTSATADLLYFDQSGALNESYSDVFAIMVDTGDFQIGEDVWTPGTPGDALRDMQDPTLYNQPAHMTNFFYSFIFDIGGVHINSGIPNKAAYLAVAAPGYGVGRPNVQQIYYRALTFYLTPSSDFLANLNTLIQASTDLYGAASAQTAAIRKSQAAVGIANSPTITFPNGGESLPLGSPATITWTSPGDAGIGWQVDALRDLGSGTYFENFEASASLPAGFTSTGNQPWFIDTFEPDAGSTRSAGSGIITHNQRSLLSFTGTTTQSGNMSFRLRVSSEPGFDFFSFWIDGVRVFQTSGEFPWNTLSGPLSAGTHQFVFVYEKDSEVSSGVDAAFIDNITIPNSENVTVESINPSTVGGAVSQAWTPSATGTNYRIRLLLPGVAPWFANDRSNALFSVVGTGADLAIAKTDSPDPVAPGGNLTYTLAVTNNGPSPATSVSVSDTLPAGASYVSATGTGWSCGFSAGTVTCTRPTLAVGAAPNITLAVTAPLAVGPFNNTASVSSATADPITTNNSDTESTTVQVGSAFYTLAPCRAVDTRDPAGPFGGPAIGAGATRTFIMWGRCLIPTSARAVAFNVTVTSGTAGGHLTLYPGGTGLPLASMLNFSTGQTRANNAIIPLGVGGDVNVFGGLPSGSAHVILDVNGYFD